MRYNGMEIKYTEMKSRNYPLIFSDIHSFTFIRAATKSGWNRVMVMRYQFIKATYPLLL